MHKLELNPFWKDGGTGLPPAEKTATKKGKTTTLKYSIVVFASLSYKGLRPELLHLSVIVKNSRF